MAIWLDIAASLLLGALLSLSTMRLNADLTARAYGSALTIGAQASAETLAAVLAEDLRKAGYGTSGTSLVIADSLQLRFAADLDADGLVDTLHYYTGGAVASTPHPDDFGLYRALAGSTPQLIRAGLTAFRLSYYNAAGDSLAAPVDVAAVRSIRIQLGTASTVAYDNHYARAFADTRVSPKNLAF